MNGKILVATDGRPEANGALRIARLLEPRLGTGVQIATVWTPLPVGGMGVGEIVTPAYLEWERMGAKAQRQQVRKRLADLGLTAARWPITLRVGATGPTIAGLAAASRAPLIVIGLGAHELVDRWFGTETALQVMRLAQVPVLAVPEDMNRLPRTAVVAVDFSPFSREAALALMDLLEPGGEVHLVHVLWSPNVEMPWSGGMDWLEEYREKAARELEALAEILEQSTDLRVHTHLRNGDPARQVFALADEVGADLIAAGSHGAGFLGRVLMGSVSTRLVRGATCAVLVSPPRTPAAHSRKTGGWSREIPDSPPVEEPAVP